MPVIVMHDRGDPSIEPGRRRSVRRPGTFAGILVLCGIMASTGHCRAAEATAWVSGAHSSARLVEARAPSAADVTGGSPSAPFLAGIEVRLDPHFITYWRDPGDAGVPPSFDVAASTNLKSAEVRYPAPERLDEAGTEAFGYSHDVVFPMVVTPLDPAKPVTLAVGFDYAVCYNICLPARAELRLTLDGRPSAEGTRVEAALAAVPRRANLGPGGPLPRILNMRPDPGAPAGERYTVEAVSGEASGTLFVEAPEGWAFEAGAPVQVTGASRNAAAPGGAAPDAAAPSGAKQLLFPVKRLDTPKGQVRPTTPVTLTLVTSSGAIEVPVQLDAGPATP